jgi:hypothetical protein
MLITTAHWHAARGLALADMGKTPMRRKELAALREIRAEDPGDRDPVHDAGQYSVEGG